MRRAQDVALTATLGDIIALRERVRLLAAHFESRFDPAHLSADLADIDACLDGEILGSVRSDRAKTA